MKELKGCLGFIALCVLPFFGLWLSADYGIHPLLFYALLGVAIGGPWLAYKIIVSRNEDKIIERAKFIEKQYPRAFSKYKADNKIYISKYAPEIQKLKVICSRKDAVWEEEEKELKIAEEKRRKELEIKQKKWHEDAERIKDSYPDGFAEWEKSHKKKWLYGVTDHAISDAENEIKALDKHIISVKWEKSQSDFTSKCYELSKEFIPNYGRYFYLIPFVKTDVKGNDVNGIYRVWEFFCEAMCQEDLDYTYFPQIKDAASWLPGLKGKSRFFQPHVYERIAKFIKEIADYYCKDQDETITVLFNYDKDWEKEALEYHYKPLLRILSTEEYNGRILCDDTSALDDNDENDDEERILLTDDVIVIFDIATENDELKNLCKKIISYDSDAYPVITYISLLKAYDKKEMTDLIDKENSRRAKIIEEKLKEEKAQRNLVESVSSWDTLVGGLHYSYLFYYYPTTCDFEATEEEWSNRWLIWDFKNTPGKTTEEDHYEALDKAISMLKNKLITTFGENNLKYLTLVCIPASSQAKTQARYEEFSNRICNETGLINAYPHISVVTEREERHLGGTGMNTSQLSFDKEFFKGKYVLLFDDVITRGDSMRTFKQKMESLGATVVGGLCLGKTKHERPEQEGFSPSNLSEDEIAEMLFS